MVPVLGLIGGVGSGKSSAARWLGARRNVVIVDGDEVGRQVLRVPAVKDQIRRRFGESVFDQQGEIVRAVLGREVFGSAAQRVQARRDLERIVHPHIRESMRGIIAEAGTLKDVEAVILDAAVLLEAGWDDLCDAVVFVDAAYRERLERVGRSRGWNEEQLSTRERSQLSLNAKRSASQFIIKNSGTVAEAGACLEQILDQILGGLT